MLKNASTVIHSYYQDIMLYLFIIIAWILITCCTEDFGDENSIELKIRSLMQFSKTQMFYVWSGVLYFCIIRSNIQNAAIENCI